MQDLHIIFYSESLFHILLWFCVIFLLVFLSLKNGYQFHIKPILMVSSYVVHAMYDIYTYASSLSVIRNLCATRLEM